MYFWLFNLAGVGIAGWALMIFLPGWSFTKWIAGSAIFPVYVAVLYTAGIVPLIASRPGIVTEFGSPDDVLRLLASADVALVVWIHILVFDQLVGIWIYRDNMRERAVPTLLQSLILFLTLMFGPAGFLLYYVIRVAQKRRVALNNGSAESVPEGPFDRRDR